MPEWVSNTDYSVSDNSNVDGNADTVMFPVVAADYDAAKFFIAKTFSRFISRMVRILRKLISLPELMHRKSTYPTM